MLNDKLKAARGIAKALGPSEDTVDNSIICNAELLISIVRGRLETGVAPQVGHKAFLQASAGLASLAKAREHIVACHAELAVTRDENHLTPRSVGCTLGKAPEPNGSADLKIVSTAA